MYVDVHVHGQSLMVSDPTEATVRFCLSAIWMSLIIRTGPLPGTNRMGFEPSIKFHLMCIPDMFWA